MIFKKSINKCILTVGICFFGLPVFAEQSFTAGNFTLESQEDRGPVVLDWTARPEHASDLLCRDAEKTTDYLLCKAVADVMPGSFTVSIDGQTIIVDARTWPTSETLFGRDPWPLERLDELPTFAEKACDSLAKAGVPPFAMDVVIDPHLVREGFSLSYSKTCGRGRG